ncbi:hypothetical protein Taro_048586 [Colocasia esculenta]|uniref:Uncharacterized protein n=1 Tax=Colocasia esculenta TaxID=4460 RepID=A0A843X8J7_COLES|nr:hypothetical protein [Colocasia esculenta]
MKTGFGLSLSLMPSTLAIVSSTSWALWTISV